MQYKAIGIGRNFKKLDHPLPQCEDEISVLNLLNEKTWYFTEEIMINTNSFNTNLLKNSHSSFVYCLNLINLLILINN